MPSAARRRRLIVPARPLFSEIPDPPGVYRSVAQLRHRWVYYALGLEARVLACARPAPDETDAAVIERLNELLPDEPRVPTLALVNEDSLIAHGLSPATHRTLSLPRLVP